MLRCRLRQSLSSLAQHSWRKPEAGSGESVKRNLAAALVPEAGECGPEHNSQRAVNLDTFMYSEKARRGIIYVTQTPLPSSILLARARTLQGALERLRCLP